LDSIRKLAETCSSLQGFIFTNALGGGTGSGFASLLLKQSEIYEKKTKMDFAIYPSPQISTAIV
jgi:tubulin alpha